jgi:hypothetical protein
VSYVGCRRKPAASAAAKSTSVSPGTGSRLLSRSNSSSRQRKLRCRLTNLYSNFFRPVFRNAHDFHIRNGSDSWNRGNFICYGMSTFRERFEVATENRGLNGVLYISRSGQIAPARNLSMSPVPDKAVLPQRTAAVALPELTASVPWASRDATRLSDISG